MQDEHGNELAGQEKVEQMRAKGASVRVYALGDETQSARHHNLNRYTTNSPFTLQLIKHGQPGCAPIP